MNQDITQYAKKRYAAKAYEPGKKISDEDLEKIKELLRLSPSSINIQPWHFILAASDEGKARVAKATEERFPMNTQSILNASHVVVFTTRTEINQVYLDKLLTTEDQDGRFADEEAKQRMSGARGMFVGLHKDDLVDWLDKQVYLNLGAFLLGVAALDITATPMEGIDTAVLDEEFGLKEKGFKSNVVVTLGYQDADKDFNLKLPKSRLPYSDILTEV